MLNYFAPFIMFISVFLMITVIIITMIKYWLKNKIVNSGMMMDDSKIKTILQPGGPKVEARGALKWGLLAFFGGVGIIINEYLPFDLYTSALPYGIELIFIALGLLIYYLIVKRQVSDKEQD